MKKRIAIVCLVGLFVLGGAYLALSAEKGSEEPYDEDTYGPEAPIVWTSPVKTVVFYHKVHTMDQGLDCDSCHDDLFEMEAGNAEQKDDFTMQSMYDGNYCGACHDGSTAFAANTRCTTCHIGVRGYGRMMKKEGKGKEGEH